MNHKHILSADQFNRIDLGFIFKMTEKIQTWFENPIARWDERNPREAFNSYSWDGNPVKFNYLIATIFEEPSTRTKSSFEAAALRLGGSVLPIDIGTSSMEKGESFGDTIKTVSQYADAIVIRSSDKGASEKAVKYSDVSIINGGDGSGEHPTQSIIDLYTIWKKKKLDNLKVLIYGDIHRARATNSFKKMAEIFNMSVDQLDMTEDSTWKNLSENIGNYDVLYMTRLQKERWLDKPNYQCHVVNNSIIDKMKQDALVLHPLPRVGELDYEVDKNPRAAYWDQVKNGMYVRMSLLKIILGHFDSAF